MLLGVQPLRGRLFLFPHKQAHAGAACISTPKIMLRAEVSLGRWGGEHGGAQQQSEAKQDQLT